MPTMGLRATPSSTAAARMEPTKGPVQEKDTMVIARATKKAAMYPPLSASRSALLASPEGRVISNAPRNDTAKTRKRRAKIRLGIQCVPMASVAAVLWKRATIRPSRV